MAHALAAYFAAPAEAAPTRSLGRRILDALIEHQMIRVRRELRAHAHLFETHLVQGDLRRVALGRDDNHPLVK